MLIQVWDLYSVRILKLFWLCYLSRMKLPKNFLNKLLNEKCQLHQVPLLKVRSGWRSPKGILNSAKYWRGTKTMIQCKITSAYFKHHNNSQQYKILSHNLKPEDWIFNEFFNILVLNANVHTLSISVMDRDGTVVFRE